MTKFIYKDPGTNTILYRVPHYASITIPLAVKEIYGYNEAESAFCEVRDILETITFGEGSMLEKISPYGFYQMKRLKKIDFRQCTKLNSVAKFAFSGSNIEEVLFPEGSLKSIGEYAFSDSLLKSIKLPASVNSISNSILQGCVYLASAVFDPEIEITTITWGTFYYCYALTEFTIPKRVNTFENVFIDCNLLQNIYVAADSGTFVSEKGVIYNKLYKGIIQYPLGRTEKYEIKAGTLYIGGCCFHTAHVAEVILPNSLTKIEGYGLACPISKVTIPDSCKNFGVMAFCYSNLTSFTFPKEVEIIDDQIFVGCSLLKRVEMPSKFDKIGGGLFSGCPDDLQVVFDKNSDFVIGDQNLVYNKAKTAVLISLGKSPEIIINENVLTIGTRIFFLNKYLTTITFKQVSKVNEISNGAFSQSLISTIDIPDSVQYIGEEAFSRCSNLKTVKIGKGLLTIYKHAFLNCPLLESIEFASVQSVDKNMSKYTIGMGCFSGCSELHTVKFGNRLGSILEKAFNLCSNLNELNFPGSVERIDTLAFYYSGLTTVRFDSPSSIQEFPPNLFDGCENLENFVFPDSVTSFGSQCFIGTKLNSFTVPSKVVTINEFCLRNCKSLITFTIPADAALTSIKYGTFFGCENFETVVCDSESFSVNNGALYDKYETRIIVVPPKLPIKFFAFPGTLKIIGEGSLYCCINMEQILIPSNSVETIERNAFEGCRNLKIINIPISVTKIEIEAFKDCVSLSCGLQIEPTDKDFISNLVENALLPRKCLISCSFICTQKNSPNNIVVNLFKISSVILMA